MNLEPIPIPRALRWREFRIRVVPILVLLGTIAVSAVLWRQSTPAIVLIGEVETYTGRISCPQGGTVTDLRITRLQRVKAGEVVATVTTTPPEIAQSKLAVIHAEIRLLRTNMEPMLAQQRFALSVDRLRLDWMEQKVELASTRTRLQQAENDLRRTEQLFREKIASVQALEEARTTRDRLKIELDERSKLVTEQERNFETFDTRADGTEIHSHGTPAGALQAAVQVEEQKLRLAEAELAPIPLIAPRDGVITAVHRHSGETVTAGESIATLGTAASDRIVAYVRQPMAVRPVAGMKVQVRSRYTRGPTAEGTILEVGTQLESVSQSLALVPGSNLKETGLPVIIGTPPALNLLPGEQVELSLRPHRQP